MEDGTVLKGTGFSVDSSAEGEVVFNTGMVGYPESFTDPSYRGQILVLTYPLVGNYGVPNKERENGLMKYFESDRIQINGLIVSEYSEKYSHWSANKTLQAWLTEEEIPALCGIDTRALTKKLREKGVMLGKMVMEGADGGDGFFDPNKINLVDSVSVDEPVIYNSNGTRTRIALIDCGTKNNIIRSLIKRDVSVIRFPWDYDIFNGKYDFDGVLISNGPGDPKMVDKTIRTVKNVMEHGMPIFGICLGNQVLGLASGADTYKLPYGHRSQNQPCKLLGTNRCYITSQNHGFGVDEKTLRPGWNPWFKNVNDGTNEGIRYKSKSFMSVQFHPEACPGPVDTDFLFDTFLKEVGTWK